MKRVNTVQLKPTKQQKKLLKELSTLSSAIYNQANYRVRQAFFENTNIPSKYDLQKELQEHENYQRLGRSYALPKLSVYRETINSRFKLIQSGTQKHVGLPKYLKNRKTNTTIPSSLFIDGEGYEFLEDNKHVRVPLSRELRNEYGITGAWTLKYNGEVRWEGTQGRGTIKYEDGHYYLLQSVEVQDPEPRKSDVSAGVDLGIKTLIAAYTNTDEELLIRDKRFYKQYSYYTNLIAAEKARLAKNHDKKSGRKLRTLYRCRTKYKANLFKNVVKKLTNFLLRTNVSTLYVGDVRGIRERTNTNKDVNRMINNYWSYDKLIHRIACKCEEHGISLELIDEAYSSQRCPECETRNKPNDRDYECKECGLSEHRDIVGAKNILAYGMRSRQEPNHGNAVEDSLRNPHRREMAQLGEEART